MTGSKQPKSRGAGPSPQGETLPISSSTRDLAEELRREATELKIRLAAIVESSDDAIVGKTLEGIITTWNKGAERVFGYTADEVVGKSVTILIPA
ncbi:MAG TPA: PAS domain S-box protein, partial [Caulifigura sp.]|nr:PAS domain S-box protein [Caulifigura sp.]